MDYNAPSFSTDADADYVGKTGSTLGSAIPPNVPTLTQREIVNAELAGGVLPANGDRTQLAQGIGRGIWLGTLGASANALVGAIGSGVRPTKPGLLAVLNPWTRLRGIALQTNTSRNVTVTVSGIGTANGAVTLPLLKRDGTLPAVGDVPVGYPFDFQPDGAGNFRLAGSVASDGVGIPALASAKVPFNEQVIQLTQRMSMSLPANSSGIFATGASGLQFTKVSGQSRFVVQGAFNCFSPIVVGQGSAAVTCRLRASIGGTVLFDDAPVTTGIYIGNSTSPCHFGASPLFLIDGLPAGNITLDMLFKRDDNLSWSTILNPTNSDVPGYPTPNNGKLVCKEEFI